MTWNIFLFIFFFNSDHFYCWLSSINLIAEVLEIIINQSENNLVKNKKHVLNLCCLFAKSPSWESCQVCSRILILKIIKKLIISATNIIWSCQHLNHLLIRKKIGTSLDIIPSIKFKWKFERSSPLKIFKTNAAQINLLLRSTQSGKC